MNHLSHKLRSYSSSCSYSYSAFCLFLSLCFCTSVLAAPPEIVAKTPVGLEGKVLYRSPDPALRPTPVDDKSELTLRIASSAQDGTLTLYDLRYIAAVPGDFDLRAFLQHADASPVTDGTPVMVRSSPSLPLDANGDLTPISAAHAPRIGGYRLALIALGLLWLAPLIYIIIKRLRRPKPIVAPSSAPPTLADQLRPLVEAAISGALGPEEQARLERLLIAHWRDRLHLLARSHNESLHTIRNHEQAGPLLAHLEQWLHQPAPHTASTTVDINTLLAPYRAAAPISLAHQNGTTGGHPA
jgi:hypothetical protein